MAWCKEKNYIPKFDQFAWHDNYYKLLEDFSTYDNGVAAPQGPVTMTFPKEGDAFGSMAQLIEQGLEEDAVLEGKREKKLPKIVDEIEGALKKTNAVEESGKKKFSLKSNPNTEARIAELESKLVTSTSVPVYSNGEVTKYITKENGRYKLTDDPTKAIAVKPSEQSAVDAYVASQYKKNPLRMIGTEQVAKPAKLSYAEKNLINAEISALRNGFETVDDAKAYDQKRKTERLKADKASVEGSYFDQAARKGDPFYTEHGSEILCDYQSAVRTIVSEAKRMGAEEVYTSAKRGSKFGSSVYLKMNGVEVRISDHHLPQTMERSDINYNQRWDSELVLTNGKMIDLAAKIKTRDDMQEFLSALFATEADDRIVDGVGNGYSKNTKFSLREKEPPKKVGTAYKVFVAKDGQLYPPMVPNPGGAGTPVGVWLDADVGETAPPSKTGRPQVQAGGKGTATGKGSLAFRPGWHLGDLPIATQFARKNPETGKKDLFPANFVWAECEYAMDVDYQEEAMSYGYTPNGKFRHSYAGLPKLPEDGYYRYRTNPNPETVPWVITGAMKVKRILTDAETDAILRDAGVEPMKRQGGELDLERLGIKAGDTTAQKNTTTESGVDVSIAEKNFESAPINQDLYNLVAKVKSGKFKPNDRVDLGIVPDDIARIIFGLTGVNPKGYRMVIEARQIKHILLDHGETGRANQSLADDNDIAKMEYVFDSPDGIVYGGRTRAYTHMKNGFNKTAPTVLYEKSIGGKSYYVVQAVPDTKAKTLFVVSAFIGEPGYQGQKKEVPQLINAKSPDATSEIGSVDTSTRIISQVEGNSNSKSSLKGVEETRAELTRIREEGAKAGKTASEIQQDVNEFVERRRAENARAESTQRSRDAGGLQPHPERWTADRVGDTDKTPMSLSDIIAKIRHDFGINITTGHVRGTGVRGQYHLNNKGIRTRIAQDLPTVAHELGHALDDRYRITGGLAAELQTELIVKSHFL